MKDEQKWGASAKAASSVGMQAYNEIIRPLFEPFARDLVLRSRPRSGETALDLACGPGTVTLPLAREIGSGGIVYAADVSPAMIALGRSQPPEPNAARIEWIEAAVGGLPLNPGSVSLVTCQQGLQFFPDLDAAMKETATLLSEGGRALYSFWASIEKIKIFRAARDALQEIDQDLARRYEAGPWSLDPDRAEAAARNGGFDEIKVEQVTLWSPTPPDTARAVFKSFAGTGIAKDIESLDEVLKASLLAGIAKNLGTIPDEPETSLTTWLMTLSR